MVAAFKPGFDYYKPNSQGFCVAKDKIIYTRYSSDSQLTTYVILDAKTMKEVSHQSFHTLHSNSLTYNPDKKEVVCVSKNHAYIFSFDGRHLSMIHDYYMNHNCPKIAYVQEEGVYYLGTSKYVFKTTDFVHLDKVFSVTEKGTDQGMAASGKYLYIIWYNVGHNLIEQYNTMGNLMCTYTLNSNEYKEVEEIDFYGEHMYISVQNSGTKNGIYMVKNDHIFDTWDILKKETCGDAGIEGRTCIRCGYTEKKAIPATGLHKESDWIVTKYPKCETAGKEIIKCKVCGHILQTQILPKKGHLMKEWTTSRYPDALHDGILKGSCTRCGEEKTEKISRLIATISLDSSECILGIGEKCAGRKVQLVRGDEISSWKSDNPSVVRVGKDGSLQALSFGSTTITCRSKAGTSASYPVKVSIWKSIQNQIQP